MSAKPIPITLPSPKGKLFDQAIARVTLLIASPMVTPDQVISSVKAVALAYGCFETDVMDLAMADARLRGWSPPVVWN